MESNSLGFTAISASEMERIMCSHSASPAEIVQYIRDALPVRRFHEVLASLCRQQETNQKAVTEAMIAMKPLVQSDSTRKRVANWFSGKNEPGNREDIIQLCFAMQLSEAQAQQFMAIATDGMFHLRSPKELAYLYCIRTSQSYAHAQELIAEIPALPQVDTTEQLPFTKQLAAQFASVSTDAAFSQFIQTHLSKLGSLHNTAYRYFCRYYQLLAQPDSDESLVPAEHPLSIAETVQSYIRFDLPSDRKGSAASFLQKSIQKYWPNETSIKSILARREDVTRKSLLLLYVATEGGVSVADDDDAWNLDDEDLTAAELFENNIRALELVLSDCGMGRLDPRNPFDQFILYSLRPQADDFSDDLTRANGMSEQLRELLGVMLQTENS